MRFLGGKHRIAPQLVSFMEPFVSRGTLLVEPFMGGGAFTAEAAKRLSPARYVAGDLHEDLVLMWQALLNGWKPPRALTRATYEALKLCEPSPLRGMAGYGSSFGGKWFGGFAYVRAERERSYWGNTLGSVKRKLQAMKRVNLEIYHGDYRSRPELDLPNTVWYCDPPYAGTTPPGAGESFDSEAFWAWATTRKGLVFVSEYVAPPGIACVLEIPIRTDMNDSQNQKIQRIERLFLTGQSVMH
jgi:DNA adenine methylase